MQTSTKQQNFSSEQAQLAVKKLSAISHLGRLALLRLLIQAGSDGINAGNLANAVGIAPPTATAQLTILAHANLIYFERQGRQIFYFANYAEMSDLLKFFMADCCCGNQEICNASLEDIVMAS